MVVIRTPPDNVAFSIALAFVFLSNVLHPVVSVLLVKVKAYRAWRQIQQKEVVEVTRYNLVAEFLGDRGKWDIARFVAFLSAAFSMSAVGLELSMDLAMRTDGPVDLLNRPPPVVFRESNSTLVGGNSTDWIVQTALYGILEGGTLGNFKGSLKNGEASATYRVGDGVMSGLIYGNTLFASWSTEAFSESTTLFYDQNDGTAIVKGMECSKPLRTGNVYLQGTSESWGVATECESGPTLANISNSNTTSAGPPTILLNSSTGNMHLLVEESSSYPSFLYSVWKPHENEAAKPVPTTELQHLFHIATTVRLAEAVVTAVANGIENGGGCVDLLSQFSVLNRTYNLMGRERILPFGERPGNTSRAVASLDQVEPVVAGVTISTFGTFCGVFILLVTVGAFAGCTWYHSHSILDVYDRDQLIRAVATPNSSGEFVGGMVKPAALRIFVRSVADRGISIVINDDGKHRGLDGIRGRCSCMCIKKVEEAVAAECGESTHHSMGGTLPPGSREISIDGVRPILEETAVRQRLPGTPRLRKSVLLQLIASPLPSPVEMRGRSPLPIDVLNADDSICRSQSREAHVEAQINPPEAEELPLSVSRRKQ